MALGQGAGSSGAEPSGSPPPGYRPVRRTPTNSSYYSFNGAPSDKRNPNSQTWMYARDARNQQAGLPTGRATLYPSIFKNSEKLSLTTPGSILRTGRGPEWLHYPLIPGRATTWRPRSGVLIGGVRSIYTDGNKNQFDICYHDPRLGTSTNGSGRFALAEYHAASSATATTASVGPVEEPDPEEPRVTTEPHCPPLHRDNHNQNCNC